MCGRFAQFTSGQALEDHFDAVYEGERLPARYNIAPGSPILICRVDEDGGRRLKPVHWGLIPSWAKDRKVGYRTINARAETAAEKPAFRAAFKRRRCLIPADGFYEWQSTPAGKQPYFIKKRDDGPFAFAGLWERWRDPQSGEELESGTILVTSANAELRPLHDRMPVIIPATAYAAWLDPGVTTRAPLEGLLSPPDAQGLTAYRVDRRVNRATEDDPSLIAALDPEG